jgi:hypothetical protein
MNMFVPLIDRSTRPVKYGAVKERESMNSERDWCGATFCPSRKLFLICAVAAVILGLINTFTEPVIRQRKVLELEQALARLTPPGARADRGWMAGDHRGPRLVPGDAGRRDRRLHPGPEGHGATAGR